MRKHNKAMAARFGRNKDENGKQDRSNLPQQLGHNMVKDKGFQFWENGLLRSLLRGLGIGVGKKVAA